MKDEPHGAPQGHTVLPRALSVSSRSEDALSNWSWTCVLKNLCPFPALFLSYIHSSKGSAFGGLSDELNSHQQSPDLPFCL